MGKFEELRDDAVAAYEESVIPEAWPPSDVEMGIMTAGAREMTEGKDE